MRFKIEQKERKSMLTEVRPNTDLRSSLLLSYLYKQRKNHSDMTYPFFINVMHFKDTTPFQVKVKHHHCDKHTHTHTHTQL